MAPKPKNPILEKPRKAKSPNKKTWFKVYELVDELLNKVDSVTVWEIKAIGEKAFGIKLMTNLIPCSLMGKPFVIDCKTYRVYRG